MRIMDLKTTIRLRSSRIMDHMEIGDLRVPILIPRTNKSRVVIPEKALAIRLSHQTKCQDLKDREFLTQGYMAACK